VEHFNPLTWPSPTLLGNNPKLISNSLRTKLKSTLDSVLQNVPTHRELGPGPSFVPVTLVAKTGLSPSVPPSCRPFHVPLAAVTPEVPACQSCRALGDRVHRGNRAANTCPGCVVLCQPFLSLPFPSLRQRADSPPIPRPPALPSPRSATPRHRKPFILHHYIPTPGREPGQQGKRTALGRRGPRQEEIRMENPAPRHRHLLTSRAPGRPFLAGRPEGCET
jgi:hypothetical protein